jgi:S-DNA-T family DNA segregation ATPase FtsK/SpoIIIE
VAVARYTSSLVDELGGIVLGGGGVFLLLSLFSWAPAASDAGWSVPPTANWGGVIGHLLASALSAMVGGGAWLIVGLMWQAALLCLTHAPPLQRVYTGVGGGLAVLGFSLLLHVSVASDPLLLGSAAGLTGRVLAASLVPYCNVGGTFLIGAVVFLLGGWLIGRPLFPIVGRGVRYMGPIGRRFAAVLWPGRRSPAKGRRRRPSSAPGLAPAESGPLDQEDGLILVAAEPSSAPAAAPGGGTEPSRRTAAASSPTAPYTKPPLSLFNAPPNGKRNGNGGDLSKQAKVLEGRLHDFGVEGRVVQVLPGPVVTMYEFEPASGIKVSRIVNLADDLALGMKALSVRIVAPVPGKSVVGIEIPNAHREPVFLRDILASPAFQQATSKLVLALGKDILGTPTVTDLAQIPHLLIAGATGSGKSVGLNSMICSLLLNATPEDVKFIMIDPKMLELSVYDGIPHLIAPVVTHPKKAAAALHWAVEEMERRYRLLAEHGVRGIDGYNQTRPPQPLPYIVVVIDELADLMLVARREVEDSLTRLAQMARAAGIHLLVATQRPSVDVLTGIIKANFPARVSFQVSSRTDSRTILDAIGAERLLGKGDMLFLPPGTSKLLRIHGAYVSEAEIKRLVEYLRTQQAPLYDFSIFAAKREDQAEPEAYDEKYDEAVALVARLGQASASLIQRHLRIGYNRAARLIEAMEREGVVGPADGSRPREVYVKEIPGPPLR